MLTAIRKSLELIGAVQGLSVRDAGHPRRGHAATYDMVCAADTVGVFQIESRAQHEHAAPAASRDAFMTWWWKWRSCGLGPSKAEWSIHTSTDGKAKSR